MVVGGFRWLWVVPSFSNYAQILADVGAHLSTFTPVSFGVSLSYFPVPMLNDINIEKVWAFQLCSHFHLAASASPLFIQT